MTPTDMVIYWIGRWEVTANYWAHTRYPTVRHPMETESDCAQLVLNQLGFTLPEAQAFRDAWLAAKAKADADHDFDLGEYRAAG